MRRILLMLGVGFLIGGCITPMENQSEIKRYSSAAEVPLPDVELVSKKSISGYQHCIANGVGGTFSEAPLNGGVRITGSNLPATVDIYQAIESVYVKADLDRNLAASDRIRVERILYGCR